MHVTQARRNRIAMFGASALLFAACSNAGGGATVAPTVNPPSAPPATVGATAAPSAQAEAYQVELADNDTYGKFLTGEDGKTLYLFMPDTTTTSSCNAGCIENWPAFTLQSGETVTGGDGVTGTFGSITRQDGSTQVTYAGHPLYYYAADKAAGDTNGEGLFQKWYLVDATGNAVMGAGSSSGGKGSY